jgi:hypothetical protein
LCQTKQHNNPLCQPTYQHYNALESAVHEHLKAATAFNSTSKSLGAAFADAALAEGAQRESSVSCVHYLKGETSQGHDDSNRRVPNADAGVVRLCARDVLTQTRKCAEQQGEVDAVQETRIRYSLLQPLRSEIAYAKQLLHALSGLGSLVNKHRKAVIAYEKAQMSGLVEIHAAEQGTDGAHRPTVGSSVDNSMRAKTLALQREANIQVRE